jgi:hypothetical protein
MLNVIDVSNSKCDGRPLNSLSENLIISALEDIYDKSQVLSTPTCLQVDHGLAGHAIRQWCHNQGVALKITEVGQHRQNAHVERLNQIIGTELWRRQVEQEIKTGQPYTKWVHWYRDVINAINQYRAKQEPKLPSYQSGKVLFNDKTKYLIEPGTKVRLLLSDPETVQGKKLPGKIRSADIKWRYTPTYVVKNYILQPNSVILYQIEDQHGRSFNHLVTNEQLQVIHN